MFDFELETSFPNLEGACFRIRPPTFKLESSYHELESSKQKFGSFN